MAGESLVVTQRTFWRQPARPAAAGVRRVVRACSSDRSPRSAARSKATRIRSKGNNHLRAVVRLVRDGQSMLTHAAAVYERPETAGGNEEYREAARNGDPRILLDALAGAIERLARAQVLVEAMVRPAATKALPGTAEKLEVMRLRHERFMVLHSDDDARRE